MAVFSFVRVSVYFSSVSVLTHYLVCTPQVMSQPLIIIISNENQNTPFLQNTNAWLRIIIFSPKKKKNISHFIQTVQK